MDIVTNLSSAPIGVPCRVMAVDGAGSVKGRMMDLGLVEGTAITPLFAGLGGDPRAYELRGAVIAFRAADAKLIKVCFSPKRRADF